MTCVQPVQNPHLLRTTCRESWLHNQSLNGSSTREITNSMCTQAPEDPHSPAVDQHLSAVGARTQTAVSPMARDTTMMSPSTNCLYWWNRMEPQRLCWPSSQHGLLQVSTASQWGSGAHTAHLSANWIHWVQSEVSQYKPTAAEKANITDMGALVVTSVQDAAVFNSCSFRTSCNGDFIYKYYSQHTSITVSIQVLQSAYKYYSQHTSITVSIQVLQSAYKYYSQHTSITVSIQVLQPLLSA